MTLQLKLEQIKLFQNVTHYIFKADPLGGDKPDYFLPASGNEITVLGPAGWTGAMIVGKKYNVTISREKE
jgi:hypothetical protein